MATPSPVDGGSHEDAITVRCHHRTVPGADSRGWGWRNAHVSPLGFGKTSSIKFLSSKIQGSFFIKIGSPLWVAFRNCSHCVTWVRFSGNGNRNCSDECLWKQGCLARRLNKLETSTSGDQGTEKYFRCFKFCTDYERPGIHTVDGSEILHQLIW